MKCEDVVNTFTTTRSSPATFTQYSTSTILRLNDSSHALEGRCALVLGALSLRTAVMSKVPPQKSGKSRKKKPSTTGAESDETPSHRQRHNTHAVMSCRCTDSTATPHDRCTVICITYYRRPVASDARQGLIPVSYRGVSLGAHTTYLVTCAAPVSVR